MTQPLSPFDKLLAQLTQGMSAAAGGTRVVNELGWQKDAQHTTEERVVWIPAPLGVQSQAFQLPDMVTPWKQASRFLVSIYGTSYDRVLQIHSSLVGWLDLLVGPPMGSVPSDDATPASVIGTVDLSTFTYPDTSLAGKTLDFVAPLKRMLTFPSGALNSPIEIAATINALAVAAALPWRARLARAGSALHIDIFLPTDPLGTEGATYTLNTSPLSSACAILGITAGEAVPVVATGTPPTSPYRPGYLVGESAEPGVRGGDLSTGGWGVIVPVTLYRPIVSFQYLIGVILNTSVDVLATGGDTPDETVVSTP